MSDDDLLDDFVAESREHLADIESRFLELEGQGDAVDPELVNLVFRAVHSVKGGAGFLGFENIQRLAHVMENLLDRIRQGQVGVDHAKVDALLRGADHLKALIDDITRSNEMDISAPMAAIEALLGSPKVSTGAAPPDATPRPERALASDLQPEPAILERLAQSPEHLYHIAYDLRRQEEQLGRDPLAALEELDRTGEIVASAIRPAAVGDLRAGLPSGPLICELVYATVFDPTIVADALEVPTEAVQPVRATVEALVFADPATGSASPPVSAVEPTAEPTDDRPAAPAAVQEPTRRLSGASRGETIRLPIERIDRLMAQAGELVLVRNRALLQLQSSDRTSRQITQQLDLVTSELQEMIMGMRLQPIGQVFSKLPRIVRDLSFKLEKDIALTTLGNEVEVDKGVLEALADPLVHLTRNACDHGLEPPDERQARRKPVQGQLTIAARHEAGQIVIEIRDDGRGIDPARIREVARNKGVVSAERLAAMDDREAVALIMAPGFSTAEQVDDVSGRGVGMDVVRERIESIGGSVGVESSLGHGSVFTLSLPLTLAIIPSLIIRDATARFAIPQTNIDEIVRLERDTAAERVEYADNQAVYRLREQLLPLVWLADVLAHPQPLSEADRRAVADAHRSSEARAVNVVVVRSGGNRFGLVVEEVLGSEEIVVKSLHPALEALACYAGSTVMGDGQVALILDVDGLARHARLDFSCAETQAEEEHGHDTEVHSELVFTIGGDERLALATGLIRRIVQVDPADFERVGGRDHVQVDGVVTEVVRLEDHLPISAGTEQVAQHHLILPRHVDRPIGLLCTDLVDVFDCDFDPHGQGRVEPGILGTAPLDERLTVFIDLYAVAEMADPASAAERRDAAVDPWGSILLAEDTPFFRNLVAGYLRASGYRVITAADGRAALELLERQTVDAVVSDLEMPRMGGLELVAALRSDQRHARLPCAALTSMKDPGVRERALAAGFDHFEQKLDRRRLLAVVDSMVGVERDAVEVGDGA